METWFQNEGFHQYLILGAEQADPDSFEVNMLMGYEGRWLLPLEFRWQGGILRLSYEISGSASLQEFFCNREMDSRYLKELFQSIWDCYGEFEEYLLPLEGFLLRPEWIYYQPGKKQFRFCYCPGFQAAFQTEFRMLVEFCMKHTDHRDSEAVLFIYRLYRLLQEGNMNGGELKQFLEEMMAEGEREVTVTGIRETSETECHVWQPEDDLNDTDEGISGQRNMDGENAEKKKWFLADKGVGGLQFYIYGGLSASAFCAGLVFAVRFLIITHRESDLKFCILLAFVTMFGGYSMFRSKKEDSISRESNMGKIEGMGERVETERNPMLIQEAAGALKEAPGVVENNNWNTVETEETKVLETKMLETNADTSSALWELEGRYSGSVNIQLNHLPGVLGRKVREVDYVVSGEGISRRHVMLFLSGLDLYAEDLASTNGTYLNGIRLKAGEPMKLCDGDQLAIGPNQYLVKRKQP